MATCKQEQSHQGKTVTFYKVVTGQNANRVVKPGWMPDWCLFVKAIPSDGSKLFTRVVWQAAIKNHTSMNKVDWRAKKVWPTAIKTFGRAGFGTAPMSAVWCQRRTGNPVNVICQLSNSSFSDDLAKCAQWIFLKKKVHLAYDLVKGTLSSDLCNWLWLLPDTLTPSLYGASCTKPKGASELKKAKMKWNCSEHIQLWYLSWRIPRSTFDLVGPLSEKWFLQEATRAGKVQE